MNNNHVQLRLHRHVDDHFQRPGKSEEMHQTNGMATNDMQWRISVIIGSDFGVTFEEIMDDVFTSTGSGEVNRSGILVIGIVDLAILFFD